MTLKRMVSDYFTTSSAWGSARLVNPANRFNGFPIFQSRAIDVRVIKPLKRLTASQRVPTPNFKFGVNEKFSLHIRGDSDFV
jgi:hypothetical protein